MKPEPNDKVKLSQNGKDVHGIVVYTGSDGYVNNKEYFSESHVVVKLDNGKEVSVSPENVEVIEKWDGKSL